jgi:hypothetical protein
MDNKHCITKGIEAQHEGGFVYMLILQSEPERTEIFMLCFC